MKQYHIIINDQKAGPYSLEELTAQQITPQTMVWTEGMVQWLPAREVEEVRPYLSPETPKSWPPHQPQTVVQVAAAPSAFTSPSRPSEQPPSYLVWSILATLFCCLIGGIVAIIYSSQVGSRYSRGDYDGANRASRSALGWIIGSAICGALGWGLYLILLPLGLL